MSTSSGEVRGLRLVAVVSTLALLSAACGQSNDSSSSLTSADSTSGTASSAARSSADLTSGVTSPVSTTAGPVSTPEQSSTCSDLPGEPEAYADAFIRAWGVGDRALMDCYASSEAVQYSVTYAPELGPGWIRLRAAGEQQTREVVYGSPNRKTTASIQVNRGLFGAGKPGQPKAIISVTVG